MSVIYKAQIWRNPVGLGAILVTNFCVLGGNISYRSAIVWVTSGNNRSAMRRDSSDDNIILV